MPPGTLEIRNHFIIRDSGEPDEYAPEAAQLDIDGLPDDALVDTVTPKKLADLAWSLFVNVPNG